VAQLVREGPTFSEHGVVRWRRVDLSRVIEARFGVQLAERSVGALLRASAFAASPPARAIPATTRPPRRHTKNVWPAPLQVVSRADLTGLRQCIRPVGACRGQDGDPRVPVLINFPATIPPFF
jgi:Winged helix-turn helix